MKESIRNSVSRLGYKSLVLLNKACKDLNLYVSLIPKNIIAEVEDYIKVHPRNITKEYLEEQYSNGKV